MPDVSLSGIEFEIRGNSAEASASVQQLISQLNGLKTALGGVLSIQKTSSAIKDVGKSASKATSPLKTFLASLKRIAMYRILRSIIKSITQAFQEGLKNAYQFSKMNDGALANALDKVASAGLTMKNQLGAAFGGLLTAIAPVVIQIINLVTRLATALSMLFAALGGQGQYKAATDAWTEWGDAAAGAGGAAKEALKYLAPFDELNVLPSEKSGGGGGGGTPDYGGMFEYKDLPEWLQDFSEKMRELAASLKITFDDVFFTWDNLTGEQIAEKAIVALGGLLGASVGFIIGGVPGAIVGTLLGVGISLEISSLIFDHDGEISKDEIKEMLCLALSGLTGGIIGFVTAGVPGALIGMTLGFAVYGSLKTIDFFTDGNFDLTSTLLDSLITMGGGVIGFKIGGVAGAAIGATIGFGLSMWLENVVFGDTSGWDAWDWARELVKCLAPAAGAMIGFAVGGPGGALLGATIGLGISFLVSSAFDEDENGESKFSEFGKQAKAWFVSGWNKAKEKIEMAVQLAKEGWTYVSTWVADFIGGAVKKGIDLTRNGWTKVSVWIKEKFMGGAVKKGIDLTRNAWTYVSSWIRAKFMGSTLAKPVDLTRNGWSTILSWITGNKYVGMNAAKKVDLSRNKWDNILSWISTNKWFGANAQKLVDLVRNKWTTVIDWVKSWFGKGSINVAVNLTKGNQNGVSFGNQSINANANYASNGLKSIPIQMLGVNPEDIARASSAIGLKLNGFNYSMSTESDSSMSEDFIYRAITRALADSDLGGDIELDGDVLYKAMVNRNRRNTRMTGVNAMA